MLKCITDALVRVAEAMQTFMVEPDIRFLHIVTTDSMRLSVLEHIAAMEHHGANDSPMSVWEAPVDPNDDGFVARIEELRADMDDLRERLSSTGEGVVVDAMPAQATAETPLGAFGLELEAAVQCIHAPLGGLIVVLSPFWVRDEARWLDDVKALSQWPTLARVRWVVVDLDEPICKPIADEFGTLGLVVDARVTDSVLVEDMATLTALAESAPDGAMGMRLAGCAGPDVAPPPRKDRPKPLTEEEARAMADKHNVPAESLLVKPMQQLRKLVLGAGTAMAHGDPARAVGSMREARDTTHRIGLERVSILMTLMMGGYALQGHAPETAATLFHDANVAAEKAKMPDLAAQAHLSMAAGLFAANKHAEAALAYAKAGQCAAGAGMGTFAIEAYRMSGELLVKQKDFEHAAQAFARACEIANDERPLERQSSSASEAARALAALLRDHGLLDAAEHLQHVAGEIEMNMQDEHTNEESEALHAG